MPGPPGRPNALAGLLPGRLQKGDPYRLKTIKDIFLEPPEPRKWERRN